MSASTLFADLQFRVECHQIVLTQAGGNAIQIHGPGEIWQDERGILNFKIFTDGIGYHQSRVHLQQPRTAGQLLADEDFFDLEAQEHGLPVWNARRVFPSTRGGIQQGLIHGQIHELRKTTALPHITATVDQVTVIFKGKLDFPCNQGTETVTRIGGREIQSTSALNVAFADDGPLHFEIRHDGNHTAVSATLPLGSLTDATPSRIQEALQFVSGKQLLLMAVETWGGGNEVVRLVSPWASRGDGRMQPPLQFQRFDSGGHFWRMFCDYFRHVHADSSAVWHPISTHLGRALEATAASLDTELLALGVAVEGLAGACFLDLAPVSPEFLGELDLLQAAVQGLTLTEQSRRRIEGTIRAMRRARNSDALRAFLVTNQLPLSLYESWSSVRNASAHGGGIQDRELERLVRLRDEVLSVLYSLTLGAINYTGPRTDYSQTGWPTANWPLVAPTPAAESPPQTTTPAPATG